MQSSLDFIPPRACDQEPIHVPGSIQPHGFLLAVDATSARISHATTNAAAFLGLPAEAMLGTPFRDQLGRACEARLLEAAVNPMASRRPLPLGHGLTVAPSGRAFDVLVHLRNGRFIVEGEEESADGAAHLPDLEPVLARMEACTNPAELGDLVVKEVRNLSGFDRVMLYRFDESWNGTVTAEDRNEALPSYLDLRFPESDIPRQARELYRLNRLRLIYTHTYTPSAILAAPDATGPLDLSLSTLRSVSPVHLQYMRNMGTTSSMSASVLRGDKLLGLISCHNRHARRPSFAVRAAIEQLTRIFSLQLASLEQAESFRYRSQLQVRLPSALGSLANHADVWSALGRNGDAAMGLASAQGIAFVTSDRCICHGLTPDEAEMRALAEWLAAHDEGRDFFATDSLASHYRPAETWQATASGLIAACVSPSRAGYVCWFRPEAARTVKWGGDPRKSVDTHGRGLNPRQSFEVWQERERGRAQPWRVEELETAKEFRNALVTLVLRHAEERAALSDELSRSNRELAAFSYTVSHDLRAPFRHIRSYAEILRNDKAAILDDESMDLLDCILDSSEHAGQLVDNLLTFAQAGKSSLRLQPIRMRELVEEVCGRLAASAKTTGTEIRIEAMPDAMGDLVLIRQVWHNLIENAVKYSRNRQTPVVTIAGRVDGNRHVFTVADNGVGFDMAYAGKLFGVFERLHTDSSIEGTGIGLATVKRIVERHGGEVSASGIRDGGATFTFTLPIPSL